MKTSIFVLFSLFSCAFGTTDLLGDVIRLPTVSDEIPPLSPTKPASLFDKLINPLSFFQNGLPCLGSSSLKSGKCLAFDACTADGGFGDGNGLCLGDSVCCVKPMSCGEISVLNNTVIANPGFPAPTNQVGSCAIKIVKPHGISHVKLMIQDLELAAPDEISGRCDKDSFSVTGGVALGFNLGKICGLNAKTHLFIPTLIELSDLFINVDLGDDSTIKRRWLIRAEFIMAKSPEAPPKGCVQYFRGETGVITSLNFDLVRMEGLGNLDGLKYAICIDSKSESCSIEFQEIFFHLGGNLTSHKLNFAKEALRRALRSLDFEMESIEARAAPSYGHNAPVAYRYNLYNRPTSYTPNRVNPATVHYRPAYYRPAYYRPPYLAPARYPVSELLYKAPSRVYTPYMNRPLSVIQNPSVYSGMLKEPLIKPEVDSDKLELLEDKLGNKLGDKLGGLLGLESGKADGLPRLCPDQDVLMFPVPDDGTSPIHCGNQLHFGGTLISSNSPFAIKVSNKGSIHGKGFAVSYRIKC